MVLKSKCFSNFSKVSAPGAGGALRRVYTSGFKASGDWM